MEVISNDTRKAKKEHICDYCGFAITKGTVYSDQFNKSDGETYHWRSHIECDELAFKLEMFNNSWTDEGLTGDDFRTNIFYFLKDRGIPWDTWRKSYCKAKELLNIGGIAGQGE